MCLLSALACAACVRKVKFNFSSQQQQLHKAHVYFQSVLKRERAQVLLEETYVHGCAVCVCACVRAFVSNVGACVCVVEKYTIIY